MHSTPHLIQRLQELLQRAMHTMLAQYELHHAAEENIAARMAQARALGVHIEQCKNKDWGEFSCALAMELARPLKQSPLVIAERIAESVTLQEEGAYPKLVAAITPMKPGFLNMRLSEFAWLHTLAQVRAEGIAYGVHLMHDRHYLHVDKPEVNVEYISANPTGPLHIAHARGAVIGDVVATILERGGHKVVREYYVNDGGSQITKLARAVHWRYCQLFGKAIDAPADYPGEYLIAVAEKLKDSFEDKYVDAPEAEWMKAFSQKSVFQILETIRADLAALRINQIFVHESQIVESGQIDRFVEKLQKSGHIYKGELDPPKGEVDKNYQRREQLLFRTTHLGDDNDRPITKPDGSWSYFAADIAYHPDKLTRGRDWLITVLGADHASYEYRLRAVVQAADPLATFDALFCQLVRLVKDGKTVRMSKRSGDFVTLSDVVDSIGPDATRFAIAMRKLDTPLDIDIDVLTAQSRENPVYYVKYAHARCCSLIARAALRGYHLPAGQDIWGIMAHLHYHCAGDPIFDELKLFLALWPAVVRRSAEQLAPHHITTFAIDAASAFHTLWTAGQRDATYRILPADNADADTSPLEQTVFRLMVIDGLRIVLASALKTLGMDAPNSM